MAEAKVPLLAQEEEDSGDDRKMLRIHALSLCGLLSPYGVSWGQIS